VRVSQRLDYALRALVLLAQRHTTDGTAAYVSGSEIAARLGLPQRVVEQQLSELARIGVLNSRRGASGGHALARPASAIGVADIVRAIEGDVLDVPHVSGSATTEFWERTADSLGAFLESTTIATLAERQTQLDSAAAEVYYI
jgi:Rrf2 family protein